MSDNYMDSFFDRLEAEKGSMSGMSELARMLATEQAPSARQQSEQARYRYLRDHCAREWDIHDYQEVLIRIPCGPSIAHCDDLDAIVDAAIAAKEASHA